MTMNVYQFSLPYDYTAEELNICRELTVFGSESWNYAWFEKFEKVAVVDADCLSEIFAIMNRWGDADEAKVTRLAPLHSLSVGDIVEKDGSFFMVDRRGWCQLASTEVAA